MNKFLKKIALAIPVIKKQHVKLEQLRSQVNAYESETKQLWSHLDAYKAEVEQLRLRVNAYESGAETGQLSLQVNVYEAEMERLRSQINSYGSEYQTFKFKSDGLYTIHNYNFAYDAEFIKAYDISGVLIKLPDNDFRWRTYNACWAAYTVRHLDGDFVECGVFLGFLSRAIVSYIGFENLNKKFYLLDSFTGTCEDLLTEGEQHITHLYASEFQIYEELKERFSDYSGIEIIKGFVPDTLPQVK